MSATTNGVYKVARDLEQMLTPIKKLKAFPGNPRKGDVTLIAESLDAHGQFRPIVVRKSDNAILAGNHTYKAATSLGWTHVAAVFVDADDEQSRRIVLADNRTGDLGSYSEKGLANLLNSLPDLHGTGYEDRDLDRLLSRLENVETFSEELEQVNGHTIVRNIEAAAVCSFGTVTYYVGKDEFLNWLKDVKNPDSFCERMKWPVAPEAPDEATGSPTPRSKGQVNPVSLDSGRDVSIADLKPLPGSPRRHALPAVMESLKANGQYRPVVVNATDNTVVIGQAVVDAAKKLKWTTVKAVMIEVDETTAKKIALMDNRTADLAWYDQTALAHMLASVDDLLGSGFSTKDVDRILDEAGIVHATDVKPPQVFLRIRFVPAEVNWGWAAEPEEFQKWHSELVREGRYSETGLKDAIAARMRIKPEYLRKNEVR